MTWSAALGDLDHYEVQLLFNDMKVFPPITLGSGVGECVLSSLTPGRLYKILVSTFSGPNQRAQFIEGRTGQTPCDEDRSEHCASYTETVLQCYNVAVVQGE